MRWKIGGKLCNEDGYDSEQEQKNCMKVHFAQLRHRLANADFLL